MPSIFPELYNYAFVVPLILRIVLAIVAAKYGLGNIKQKDVFLSKATGWLIIASTVFVTIGLFVQAAALVIILSLLFSEFLKSKTNLKETCPSKMSVLFLITVATSILLLGPGIFSFDLPL